MAVNKVIYGGRTLIDLTSITVTPETLAEGVIAINAKGEIIVGKAKVVNNWSNISNSAWGDFTNTDWKHVMIPSGG